MAPLHGLAWNKKNANEDGVYVAEAFCVGTGSRLHTEFLHKDGDEESLVSGLACDSVSPTYIPTTYSFPQVRTTRMSAPAGLTVTGCPSCGGPLLQEGGPQ